MVNGRIWSLLTLRLFGERHIALPDFMNLFSVAKRGLVGRITGINKPVMKICRL